MKTKIMACICLLFLLGACAYQTTQPSQLSSSSPYPALKNEIDRIMAGELTPHSMAAIKVVALESGKTIYETNAELLLNPASLQKLFTAAASLSLLGSEQYIETSISISPDHRTLYLHGCGDPLLKTADLATMVNSIAAKLPAPRRFSLTGDSGCFDELYWGKGWMWDDEPAPEAMYISPLSVNGNSISVTVRPGPEPSSPVLVATDPTGGYALIESDAKTVAPGGACAVSITRAPGDRENRITVSGSLSLDCLPTSKMVPDSAQALTFDITKLYTVPGTWLPHRNFRVTINNFGGYRVTE